MNKYITNSFQVPNAIIDDYFHLMSEYEIKCYLFIARKTKGWGKTKDSISISQFKKVFKAKDDRTVKNALKELIKKDLIIKLEMAGKPSVFELNLTPNPLHGDDPTHENVPPTSSCNDPLHGDVPTPPTSSCTPQKHNKHTNTIYKKNILKKDFTFALANKTQYENLTEEYKNKLFAFCLTFDGGVNYENFILSLEANGYKYKNFKAAYAKWYIKDKIENHETTTKDNITYKIVEHNGKAYAIDDFNNANEVTVRRIEHDERESIQEKQTRNVEKLINSMTKRI